MPGKITTDLINFYDSYETQLQTVRENIVSLESLLREMGRNRVHPKVMQESFAYYRLWKKALQILLETHQKFNQIPNDLRPIFLRNPPRPPPPPPIVHTGCVEYEFIPPPSTLHAGGMTFPYPLYSRDNPTGHLTKKPKR